MNPFTDNKVSTSTASSHPLRRLIHLAFVFLAIIYGYMFYSAWTTLGAPRQPIFEKAIVVLSGTFNVSGTVTFYQPKGRGPVTVSGNIRNLDPDALRGFHVHQLGDLSQGCLSTGPHFNPFGKTHGAPTDKNRHVGDLGNIKSDTDGSATFAIKDSQLSLNGPLSIIGRAVVVHAGTDDLGQGGNGESLKTGNAGARAACGVIGILA